MSLKTNTFHGRLRVCWIVFLTLSFAVVRMPCGATEPAAVFTSNQSDWSDGQASLFVTNHCVACHNASDRSGDLDLESFSKDFQAMQEPAWDSTTWEKVAKRLRSRQMPPADGQESTGQIRPDESSYVAAVNFFERSLDVHAERFPNPGRTSSIRRLNRTEYQNAIRDLLAIEIDSKQLLPADQSSHGFDNITVVELSPTLLNRYLSAAEQISRLAVGGNQRTPGGTNIRLPADRTQESHVAGLPLGTRGGDLVRHHFPQTGTYEVQVRLARDRDEKIEGLTEANDIDILLDRKLVERLTVYPPKIKDDHTLLDSNLRTRFHVDAGPHDVGVTFPMKHSSLSEIKRQPFDASYNRHRHPRRSPAIFEISIVGPFDPEGPGDTPSRRVLFGGKNSRVGNQSEESDAITNIPGETIVTGTDYVAEARAILSKIARQAYRRKLTDADLQTPMAFFMKAFESQGADRDAFEAGIQSSLASILVNPNFLFRIESDPNNTERSEAQRAYQVTDFELATRLSFFLWSSIPDDELLELAEANRLHEPSVIKEQVRRMLKDPRSNALVENFASQWLYLRNLDSINPDLRLFPDFDDNLRQAFREETQLLFKTVLDEDRSVLDLLAADFTFLNERLAKHYGIANVSGSHFRKVMCEPQNHRGGLLRHGSILTVTSYATRTSPTIRGNWILQNILGTPPPPPPPNVPALKEKSDSEFLSVRERLAEHRENPACASCHNLMDPIGFALENYDAVGRWRIYEGELPIDVSGILPDGSRVAGIDDLESAIMQRPEEFVGTMVEKLMTFALGRGIDATDGPAVRSVVRHSKHKDERSGSYRFSDIITGVVLSEPFQMRLFESEKTTQ